MITEETTRAGLKTKLFNDITKSKEYVPQRDFLYNMIIEDFVKTLDSSDAINDVYIKTNTEKLSKFLTNYLSKPRVNSWIESVKSTEFKRDGEYQLRITEAFEEQLKQENKNAVRHQEAVATKEAAAATKIQEAFRKIHRERVAEEAEIAAQILEQTFITAATKGNTQLLNYTVFTLADRGYLTPESLGALVANGFYEAAENNNMEAIKKLKELAETNPALLKAITEYDPTYNNVAISDDLREALTKAITHPPSGKEGALADMVEQSRQEFLRDIEIETFRPLQGELGTALVANNKSKIDNLLRRIEEAISKVSERKRSTSHFTASSSGSSTPASYDDLLRRIGDATSTRSSRKTSRTTTPVSDEDGSALEKGSGSSATVSEVMAASAPKNVTLIDSLKGEFKRAAMEGKADLLPQIKLSLTRNGFQNPDLNTLYIESFCQLVDKGKNNNSVAKLQSMLVELGHKTTSPVIEAIHQYKREIPGILALKDSVHDHALARLKRKVIAQIEIAPIIASLRSPSSAAPAASSKASRSKFHR